MAKTILAEIVFNKRYAEKMHDKRVSASPKRGEWVNLGKRSIAEGPSGDKFMSKHFAADGGEFFRNLWHNILRRITKL